MHKKKDSLQKEYIEFRNILTGTIYQRLLLKEGDYSKMDLKLDESTSPKNESTVSEDS